MRCCEVEAREIWLCRNNEVAENMKEGSKYATKPTLHSNFYPLRHQQQTLHEPHNGASESLSPLSDSSPHSVDGEISNAAVSLFARGRDYLRDHVAQVYVVGECAPLVFTKTTNRNEARLLFRESRAPAEHHTDHPMLSTSRIFYVPTLHQWRNMWYSKHACGLWLSWGLACGVC